LVATTRNRLPAAARAAVTYRGTAAALSDSRGFSAAAAHAPDRTSTATAAHRGLTATAAAMRHRSRTATAAAMCHRSTAAASLARRDSLRVRPAPAALTHAALVPSGALRRHCDHAGREGGRRDRHQKRISHDPHRKVPPSSRHLRNEQVLSHFAGS
jgi:hypothetical protein